MTVLLHVALIWLTLAAVVGLTIGAVIAHADRQAAAARGHQ